MNDRLEVIRWRAHRRRILGFNDFIEDAEGARRAIAEGDWLSVGYLPDRSSAFIEAVDRAQVRRMCFSVGIENAGNVPPVSVKEIWVKSSVGTFI